jgi:uncharacterized protein YgiM (DUF1202 family)
MNDVFVHRLVVLSAVLFALPASAEQMFVTDKLVLSVYAEPNPESERIETLETGDTVEVLEHGEDFLRVRLADEREGWVGVSYLTAEPPASIRVRTLEKEHKGATQTLQKQHADQLAQLQKQNTQLQSEVENLKKTATAPSVPAVRPSAPPVTTEPAPARSSPASNRIWIWISLALLTGALGYLAGYQILARRIRNKFGGVKIY